MNKYMRRLLSVLMVISLVLIHIPYYSLRVDAAGRGYWVVDVDAIGDIREFYFIPHYTGLYDIYSTFSSDTYGEIYESTNDDGVFDKIIASNDDRPEGSDEQLNFYISSVNLKRGRVYKIVSELKAGSVANDYDLYADLVQTTVSNEVVSSGSGWDYVWSIDSEGTMILHGTTEGQLDISVTDKSKVKRAKVNLYRIATEYMDMSSLFREYTNLEEVDFTYTDCSGVQSFANMFYGCSSLKSIDMSTLNKGDVIYYYSMFNRCTNLKTVNMGNVGDSKLREADYMFYNCSSLESVDFSGYISNELYNVKYMFANCENLKSIDFSNTNLSGVTSYYAEMFSGCERLEKIITPTYVSRDILLHGDGWEDLDGNNYTILPKNLSNSIQINRKVLEEDTTTEEVTTEEETTEETTTEEVTTEEETAEETTTKEVTMEEETAEETTTKEVTTEEETAEETTTKEVTTKEETTEDTTTEEVITEEETTEETTEKITTVTSIKKVRVKSSKIIKTKRTSRKKAKIIFKKVKGASGYYIRYSRNKSCKTSKSKLVEVKKGTQKTKVIKGLKAGKRYYVKIRTYKMVNGTKIKSNWSKPKMIKAKVELNH